MRRHPSFRKRRQHSSGVYGICQHALILVLGIDKFHQPHERHLVGLCGAAGAGIMGGDAGDGDGGFVRIGRGEEEREEGAEDEVQAEEVYCPAVPPAFPD